MKPRSLGLALVALFPLAVSAQESGPSGPSQGTPAPGQGSDIREGARPGGRHRSEGRRNHHPPGCSCCSGGPILFPPIIVPHGGFYGGSGLGYGGGFGGFSGITIGPAWPDPFFPYAGGPSYRRSSPAPQGQGRIVRRPKPKLSSPEARARAAQHIELGDRAFQEQDYGHALSRYKKAIASAPDQADARFRIAQAYVAIGRFALAAREIERGLYLDPTWPDSDFSVEELYNGNEVARLADLERLAQAARDDLDDSDLLFLLGYQLYFNGEPERAIPFFERALDLTDAPNVVLLFLEIPVRQAAGEPGANEPPANLPRKSSEDLIPAGSSSSESRRI